MSLINIKFKKQKQKGKNYTKYPICISIIHDSDEEDNLINVNEEDIDYELLKEENILDEYYNLFNFRYSDKIYEIEELFNNTIFKLGLPFMDTYNINYDIYDFIKYNSFNYDIVIKDVNNYEKEDYNYEDNSDDENNYNNDMISNY